MARSGPGVIPPTVNWATATWATTPSPPPTPPACTSWIGTTPALSVRTDASGQATAWLFLPAGTSATNFVTVTAPGGVAPAQIRLAAAVPGSTNNCTFTQLSPDEPPFPVVPGVWLSWLNYD